MIYFSFSRRYYYDDYVSLYDPSPSSSFDPVNLILNKASQLPSASAIMLSPNGRTGEMKAVCPQESLMKMLKILLSRGFKFNPKGALFNIPQHSSILQINFLMDLMKEIEKESEPLNFEMLKFNNIVNLIEQYSSIFCS